MRRLKSGEREETFEKRVFPAVDYNTPTLIKSAHLNTKLCIESEGVHDGNRYNRQHFTDLFDHGENAVVMLTSITQLRVPRSKLLFFFISPDLI